MTSPDRDHPYRDADVRLARLLFCGAFAAGVDGVHLRSDLSFGLVDPRDVAALQSLRVHVERTARAYAMLTPAARERLGIARCEQRAKAARGFADSGVRS